MCRTAGGAIYDDPEALRSARLALLKVALVNRRAVGSFEQQGVVQEALRLAGSPLAAGAKSYYGFGQGVPELRRAFEELLGE